MAYGLKASSCNPLKEFSGGIKGKMKLAVLFEIKLGLLQRERQTKLHTTLSRRMSMKWAIVEQENVSRSKDDSRFANRCGGEVLYT